MRIFYKKKFLLTGFIVFGVSTCFIRDGYCFSFYNWFFNKNEKKLESINTIIKDEENEEDEVKEFANKISSLEDRVETAINDNFVNTKSSLEKLRYSIIDRIANLERKIYDAGINDIGSENQFLYNCILGPVLEFESEVSEINNLMIDRFNETNILRSDIANKVVDFYRKAISLSKDTQINLNKAETYLHNAEAYLNRTKTCFRMMCIITFLYTGCVLLRNI